MEVDPARGCGGLLRRKEKRGPAQNCARYLQAPRVPALPMYTLARSSGEHQTTTTESSWNLFGEYSLVFFRDHNRTKTLVQRGGEEVPAVFRLAKSLTYMLSTTANNSRQQQQHAAAGFKFELFSPRETPSIAQDQTQTNPAESTTHGSF